ncbi:hypothetical protein AB0L22_09460 [Micromonospora haikouensis]|uniref:hypothetical protein n=1 Tax=Micromonospora haikouensis TaxID=686309 RepID=UPI00343E1B08
MIREDAFLASRRPYAVDLSSLTWETVGDSLRGTIRAAWFRRRQGVTVACVGSLWDYQDETTSNPRLFLARHADGRYGGDCEGRWDGTRYWGAQDLDVMAEHLALLKPMLAAYPNIPPGHDGWWRF